MPRPPAAALVAIDAVDVSPVAPSDPGALLGLFERMIRAANGDEYRRRLMREVDFPSDDVPTFLAVNQLSLHGALRPTDLAERMETGRANVSKIVRRLEAMELVARVADPADDRGVLVALTAGGRTIAARVVRRQQAGIDEVLAGWPAADVATLRALLTRWVDRFEEVERPAP